MRDFKRMQTDPPAGVSASPIADNVMTWYVLSAEPRRCCTMLWHGEGGLGEYPRQFGEGEVLTRYDGHVGTQ